MRERLKIAVLQRLWGRSLYGVFRRARTVYLMFLLYAGFMSRQRLDEIAAKKHITMSEMITALDRIPRRYKLARYNLAEQMRLVKTMKKHERDNSNNTIHP
jgi:hypothetical protein